MRELKDNAPHWQMRVRLLELAEENAQVKTRYVFSPQAEEISAQRGYPVLQLLGEVGKEALFSEPMAWAANAWMTYAAQWMNVEIYGQDFIERHGAYIEAIRDPFVLEMLQIKTAAVSAVFPSPSPRWKVLLNRVGTVALLSASLLVLGLVAWQWAHVGAARVDRRLAVAALSSLAVHSYFLTVGLFSVVSQRYSNTMWPFQVLCALLLLHWLLDCLKSRLASRPLMQYAS